MRSACPSARVTRASTSKPERFLHQRVPQKGEPGLHARSLAVEPRVGIRGRGVRCVRTLLPAKVGLGVASACGRRRLACIIAAGLRLETLHRGPRLDQRTVHREVLARQQRLHPALRQHCGQELRRDVAAKQPVPVLREGRVIPHRIVDAEADEPTEQKIVLQPLHQLPFRADRVEGLAQHRPEQLLRRDGWSPDRRIEIGKRPMQIRQRLVYNLSDRPQRMVAANPLLEIDIAEQFTRQDVTTTHDALRISFDPSEVNHDPPGRARILFQQPASQTAT